MSFSQKFLNSLVIPLPSSIAEKKDFSTCLLLNSPIHAKKNEPIRTRLIRASLLTIL